MSKHLEDKNLIARWMDDRLSNEEKEQLKKTGELDALKAVVDDIDTWKVKPFDVDAGLAKLKNKNASVVPINSSKNKTWWSIAAGVAVLLTCSFLWYYLSNGNTTVVTEIAENRSITLPKGTLVELDAASSISYNKNDWDNTRLVELKGQAYFNVTSGNSFIVETPTAQISVLGTQFNVSSQNEQFSVYCYEGKIKVSYRGDSEIITVGQSVILNDGKLQKSTHQSSGPEWMKGISTYDRTPLKTVISDVKRYYNVNIDLPSKYENQQFTGTIAHKDLQHTLSTIFTTMEIEYSLIEDNTVIFE